MERRKGKKRFSQYDVSFNVERKDEERKPNSDRMAHAPSVEQTLRMRHWRKEYTRAVSSTPCLAIIPENRKFVMCFGS